MVSLQATLIIQAWWRRRVSEGTLTESVMRQFGMAGIRCEQVREMGIESLQLRLRDRRVLEVMRKTCLRVFYISYGKGGTGTIAESNLDTWVFLSAYQIRYYPQFVFERKNGGVESELCQEAKML
eukprot:3228139-Rhodomonas_salina.1